MFAQLLSKAGQAARVRGLRATSGLRTWAKRNPPISRPGILDVLNSYFVNWSCHSLSSHHVVLYHVSEAGARHRLRSGATGSAMLSLRWLGASATSSQPGSQSGSQAGSQAVRQSVSQSVVICVNGQDTRGFLRATPTWIPKTSEAAVSSWRFRH